MNVLHKQLTAFVQFFYFLKQARLSRNNHETTIMAVILSKCNSNT